ncbi:MAG: hypothetical protein GY820_01755, partial [Gammaproteobacteria bacterium]|nr:hypothetical protein [Gammaproteobacteria bacterium]
SFPHFSKAKTTKTTYISMEEKGKEEGVRNWSVAKLLRDITTLPKSRQISPLKITDIDKSLFFHLRSSYKIHLRSIPSPFSRFQSTSDVALFPPRSIPMPTR